MDNLESDNREPDKLSSPAKPRSRKWLYIVLIVIILFSALSTIIYVSNLEKYIKREALIDRLESMNYSIGYSRFKSGYNWVDSMLVDLYDSDLFKDTRLMNNTLIKVRSVVIHGRSNESMPPDIDIIHELSFFSSMEMLSLTNYENADLSPLSKLTNLSSLNLTDTHINDLAPLSKLNNLIALLLTNTKTTDLTPLSKMKKINFLYIGNNQITDLSPLSKLSFLQKVEAHSNQITDLSPLTRLTYLKSLDLTNNPDLKLSEIIKLRKALPNCEIAHNTTK